MSFVVVKFGGTSVSTAARWHTIATVARGHVAAGRRPVVVCSALTGVSDQIAALLDGIAAGRAPDPALEALAAQHATLARDCGVDPGCYAAELEDLRRVSAGAWLLGEVSPKVRARAMAAGELMSTRLGAAFFARIGLALPWLDARTALTTDDAGRDARHYLAASCRFDADPALAARLATGEGWLTQGFLARDADGATVLLGRGGSDTSAAYLAARLGAEVCEIWTDVPGMFTANPRAVPGARLLRALDYDEAQEIAATGAKVLHPRCLAPVKAARVPLVIRDTTRPGLEGTRIAGDVAGDSPQVKAISVRTGLVLVALETLGMWQEVGFLAEAFAIFARHRLSVDLVSTSETNVTVTLDPAANALDPQVLAALLADLRRVCVPRTLEGCASISLVGRGIRAILHRLSDTFALFESQRVHLVTQAANDLNLTFVVDADQADRLVRQLHAELFGARVRDDVLGATWEELTGANPRATAASGETTWWLAARPALLALAATGSPRYVLHGPTIDASLASLRGLEAISRVWYAAKANPSAAVLRRAHAAGLGLECVSPGELALAHRAVPGISPRDLLFTPNFAPRAEYAAALAAGHRLTLDNLHPLLAWPELFAGADVQIRLDPGVGRGHHAHVRTAGTESKFGISADQLPELHAALAAAGARVVGLHAHVGSGILEPESWVQTALFLAQAAEAFPDVRVLDLGGGLGVPARPGQAGLDLRALDAALLQFRRAFPRFELWLEPGRYVVAEAGALLATVTQVKRKGDQRFIGVDTGMNSLIRPALYGAWHEIVNLTRYGEPATGVFDVVGPICESGDVLGFGRALPETREGDVLLVANTGAYGRAMSSWYNLREPAAEATLD